MNRIKQAVLLACACALLTLGKASATTIDFSTLSGVGSNNGTPFTTYTENNYTVAVTAGTWQVNNVTFGDPLPSIFTEGNAGGTISVTRNIGTLFTFSGVDLGQFDGHGEGYTITGYLAGNQVFTKSGTLTDAFLEYGTGYSADTLSRLTIQFTGTEENVDNILVDDYVPASVTPEPSSLVLIGTGVLGVAGVMRRRMSSLRG